MLNFHWSYVPCTGCWASWPAGDPEMSWRLTVMRVPIGISPCVCSCVSCERWLSERFIAPSDANWPQSSDSVSSPVSSVHSPLTISTAHGQLATVNWLLPSGLLTASYSVRDYLATPEEGTQNEWHKCEHIYISIGLAADVHKLANR